jgi:hypothetical protein
LKQRRIYLKLRLVAGATTLAVAAAAVVAMAPITDGAVRGEVDRLLGQVTSVRRLPFRGPLAARAVTGETADALVTAALAARITTSNLGVEEQIMKRLGLIAGAADYAKLWAAGPASAPAATYDPAAQRLLVPDFLPLDGQRVALIHEIAHAVADQRFDLRRFLAPQADAAPGPLDGDATRARLALVEGDATLATLEVVDGSGAFLRPTALGALADRLRATAGEGRPPWLAELTRFMHVDGLLFVAQVRARQPWSAVDGLWRDPPASSEQVLHRDKYETCDSPIAVPESIFPSLPGFDRPKASDVMGELVVRAWLTTALPPEIAARAAAGWGGDRAALYSGALTGSPAPRDGLAQGDPALPHALAAAPGAAPTSNPDGGAAPTTPATHLPPLAWLTIWDDGGEADDFARAAAATAGGANVMRRGDAVALFLGAPELAPAALEGMLDGWKATLKPAGKGGRPRRAAQTGCPRRDRAAAPR